MMQRVLVTGCLLLAACGSQATTPGPASPESAPPPASTGSTSTVDDAATSSPSDTASATEVPTGEAKPVEEKPKAGATPASIHEVCFAMCDKLKPKCPRSSFEACQLNCGKYESPAEGCADVVQAALVCARDAADLVCANVAPESCAKPFRRIAACAAGESTVEADTTTALPAEFSEYENAAEGVSAPMPEGVKAGEGTVLATVTTSEGTVYSIRKLPRPAGKVNEKVLLKTGMALFGRCSDKMKLQGMVDKPGRTSMHYTTKCPDGSEEAGLFWATDKALFIASAKGQPGKLGPTDVFLYGFEAK